MTNENVWLAVVAILGGFVLLAWSADRFVYGASAAAANLGISPLIVGLTIVGFGTSSPELFVSVQSAYHGNPNLAVGNAVGSNIANVGMVLGFAALISPLVVKSDILRREFPLMLAAMLLALSLIWDGTLDRADGAVLVLSLTAYVIGTVFLGIRQRRRRAADGVFAPEDPLTREYEQALPRGESTAIALGWTALGLVVLIASARILVWGAVDLARAVGVSDLMIGLTVVAIGTSLPEVATAISGSLRQEDDIAVGNVLGSNIFNILGVTGVAATVRPTSVEPAAYLRDFPLMLALSAVVLVFALVSRRINRWHGGLLVTTYAAYLMYLGTQLHQG